MTLDTFLTALDDAAGCGCCANRAPIADLLGIPHCANPASGWCDDDEDFSGDAACPWHKADPSFHDLARAVLDRAVAQARPHIERETLRRAADEIDLSDYYGQYGAYYATEKINAEGAAESWLCDSADRIEGDQ